MLSPLYINRFLLLDNKKLLCYNNQVPKGYRQAVRQGTLTPSFVSSNLATPANKKNHSSRVVLFVVGRSGRFELSTRSLIVVL